MNRKKNRCHLFFKDYFIQMLVVDIRFRFSFEHYDRNLVNGASNVCFQGLQGSWLILVDFRFDVARKKIIQKYDITRSRRSILRSKTGYQLLTQIISQYVHCFTCCMVSSAIFLKPLGLEFQVANSALPWRDNGCH